VQKPTKYQQFIKQRIKICLRSRSGLRKANGIHNSIIIELIIANSPCGIRFEIHHELVNRTQIMVNHLSKMLCGNIEEVTRGWFIVFLSSTINCKGMALAQCCDPLKKCGHIHRCWRLCLFTQILNCIFHWKDAGHQHSEIIPDPNACPTKLVLRIVTPGVLQIWRHIV
jgi:hypothetical protein